MFDVLNKVGFEELPDETPEESLKGLAREIVVECDECGHITTTTHLFCGEFLPISMYCICCKKHVPAHAHYKESQK